MSSLPHFISTLTYLIEEPLNPLILNIWTNHRPQDLAELFEINSPLSIASPPPCTSSVWPVWMRLCSSSCESISQEQQVFRAQPLGRTHSTSLIAAQIVKIS